MSLEGAKVVIVGGSSGVGLGAAKAIVERGADVVLVGRSVDRLQHAARVLDAPQQVSTISADVTVEADVERMFSQVGAFDHLVVTRGTPPPAVPIECGMTSSEMPSTRSGRRWPLACLLAASARLPTSPKPTYSYWRANSRPALCWTSMVAMRSFRVCLL